MINKEKVLILGEGFLGKEFIRQGYKYHTTRKQENVNENTFYLNVDSDLLSVHLEKIFDKIQFANLNSKLKYIFNAIPNPNIIKIKNKEIRNDFYEKCNNFIQFITRKPNDYISIAKEKGLIN